MIQLCYRTNDTSDIKNTEYSDTRNIKIIYSDTSDINHVEVKTTGLDKAKHHYQTPKQEGEEFFPTGKGTWTVQKI